jgi:predicted transcriptional regulator
MTTKFIGIKEFRQNISKLSKKTNQRLVVLNRNTPVFEVKSLRGQDVTLDKLALDIQQGLEDAKAGRVYTQSQVESMLGL